MTSDDKNDGAMNDSGMNDSYRNDGARNDGARNDGDRDPVEAFFARERDRIVAHDGDDVHWQSIVRQARIQRRSRLLGYAAGVAAAVLVIGFVSYGTVLDDRTPPVTAATNTDGAVRVTPGPVTTGQQTSGPGVTVAPPPSQSVPQGFAALSITNVGQGNIFVLGSSDCGSLGRCPTLIGSTDDGRTWQLVNTFRTSAPPAATTPGGGEVQAADVLSQVRFANANVGWVFGSDVQYTTDGGKTFQPYDHVGQFVTDLETDGQQVIVASADDCANRVCTGARHVARAAITAAGATQEVGTGAAGGELADLQIVFDARTPYLWPRWLSAPKGDVGPQRITESGLEALNGLGDACGNPAEQDVIATADPQGGLFGFCATPGAAMGSIGMAVFNSTNMGSSWQAVSSQALFLVNAGPRSFAATGAQDILAASAGNPDTHGSLRVSHDGGRTWGSPAAPPPMPSLGWAWVGAPGGSTFYAISHDPSPDFWKSDDSGETWTKVGLAS